MKKDKINSLLGEGFKIKVFLTPDNSYKKMVLKTILFKDNTDIIYPVYYNHVKDFLTDEQKTFIDTYQTVKNWQFKNDVEANIKFKKGIETKEDIQKRVIREAIKTLTYLEQ